MLTNRNKRKRKYLLFFLTSLLTLFAIFIIIRFTGSNPAQSPIKSKDEITYNQQDTIETTKEAWGKLLSTYPLYNGTPISKENKEKTPGY
ncbi:MAG TPA: hypothetical protein VFG10_07065 [Saprospiraceae bacterium]|nr:hypothetical protein [Saprospiraceae bacterium]